MEKNSNKKQGLGDFIEMVIEKTVPKLAAEVKKNGCNCEKKKAWLNNFGAKFG